MNTAYNEYIPEYHITFSFKEKSKDYCLVIPVINEGLRIHQLLEKIQNLNLHDLVDILIVDGGSDDGSLDEDYLRQVNVRTLLLKTGPGKLGAQLLCAYDFALRQNYRGIVTIDGNDKDDPSPIPAFIMKLQEGFDFVQASRFIPGGRAINTPKARDLAIRYIHAPLLSMASGFKWTDTTQGFRAYSARLLVDRRIAIFRQVLLNYELLTYLSYIAPKLGYKCVEMPSIRIYPKGKVPTKISAFKGNWNLMKTLIKTICGKFNLKID